MRRGCVSLGELKCDNCKRTIPVAARYLITDELTDENGKKKTVRYCLKCCQEKGVIGYRHEKDEKVLTFFPPDERTVELKPAEKLEEEDLEKVKLGIVEPEEKEEEDEEEKEEESEDEEKE
jgi:hypothetical protein